MVIVTVEIVGNAANVIVLKFAVVTVAVTNVAVEFIMSARDASTASHVIFAQLLLMAAVIFFC